MIIKVLAMFLVLVSSVMIGKYFSLAKQIRAKELFNLADSIEVLQNELEYSMEPVEELFYRAKEIVKGYSKDLFEQICIETSRGKTVGQAWQEAVEFLAPDMNLCKEDINYLTNCSDVFDAYEASRQMTQFGILKNKINLLADNAQKTSDKNSKLYKMLGFYCGVLICAILF